MRYTLLFLSGVDIPSEFFAYSALLWCQFWHNLGLKIVHTQNATWEWADCQRFYELQGLQLHSHLLCSLASKAGNRVEPAYSQPAIRPSLFQLRRWACVYTTNTRKSHKEVGETDVWSWSPLPSTKGIIGGYPFLHTSPLTSFILASLPPSAW